MLHDLEHYADLLECMSEIQEVDTRVQKCVDELQHEQDAGFLGTYEDFSFCSTAQVQNGNVNQMQGAKVVTQNGIAPVQSHEMQEPLIAKVMHAQTSTGDGIQ